MVVTCGFALSGLFACAIGAFGAGTASAATDQTLYAYAGGTATSSTCPQTSTVSDQCSLELALTDAGGDTGDTIYLETAGSDAHYIGNWTVFSDVTIAAAPDITGTPVLDGNGGSSTNCPTTNCNAPILSFESGLNATVRGVTFENGDNTSYSGGAVYSYPGSVAGTLTFTDDTFSNNQALVDGGAVDVLDGSAPGAAVFTGDTFSNNNAQFGGAISAGDNDGQIGGTEGTVTITNSTFSGNQAVSNGGAIQSSDNLGNVAVSVSGTTFSGNTAGFDGGAIFASGNQNSADTTAPTGGNGSLSVSNSTFYNNTATDSTGAGGAIDSSDNSGAGELSVWDSTFSGNSAAAGRGSDIANGFSGGSGSEAVAANAFGDNCAQGPSTTATWTDAGYNVGLGSCLNGGTADVTSSSLQLGGLADNGGATETMVPASSSPVVGVVPTGTTKSLNGTSTQLCSRTDQRGFNSVTGAACSAGAAEILSIALTTASPLPDGTFNAAYSGSVAASGGDGSYTYSVSGVNTPPAGVSVNSDGSLTGTPTSHGTSTFTVSVADSDGDIGSKSYSLTIDPATATAPTITNLPSGGNVGGSFVATVSETSSGDDGALSVQSQSTSVCSVTGGTTVNFLAAGTCRLTAQAAASSNGDYAAATGVQQTIAISQPGAPTVKVTGVTNAASYTKAPRLHCQASDSQSPIASCTIKLKSAHSNRGLDITTVHYTVTATTEAGVSTTVTGTYKVLGIYLRGTTYRGGGFTVRGGHRYTLVVAAHTKPIFVTPSGVSRSLHSAGKGLWSLKITIPAGFVSGHRSHQLKLKIGRVLHRIPVRGA